MEPNTRNSAGYSKPIPSYQNSGTLVQNKIWKRVREWKSQLIVSGVVVIFAVLSLLNETLDLPHLLANAPPTPINWAEIAIDAIILFLVGVISIFILNAIESKRRRAEEALRVSEEKMRTIFDSMPDVVLQLDTNLEILWANKATLKLNPHAEGQFCYKALPGRNDECPGCPIVKALKTGQIERGIVHFQSVTGVGESYWDNVGTPIKDTQGKITSIVKLARNITQRKRIESKFKQNENMLRQIIDTSPNCIFVKDRNGMYLVVNKRMVELHSTTPEELVGKYDYEIAQEWFETVDYNEFRKAEQDVIDNKKTLFIIEEPFVYHDGTERWFQTTKIPFEMEDNQNRLLVISTDITERKRAEEALRKSEEKYKFLYEESQSVNLLIGMDGKIVDANKFAVELLGYHKKDVIGKDTMEFVVPEQREAVVKQLAQYLKGEQTPQIQLDIIGKEGTRTLLFKEGHGTIIESGRPVGILISALDITENRKMEAQLIQAERLTAVGTLAYGIAHEFNNILAGILGNAEFGMGSDDSKEVEGCFRVIMENCDRAGSITNSLLTLARQRQVKKEVADLTDAVENVVGLVERELEKQNIRVDLKFKPVPEIVCDLGELSEVFLNMITNARDAMKPDGGALTIELRKRNDNIEIIFADTGGGIPDEIKGRIFEPFVTTKGALGQSEIPGTGLGLFFSIGIISRYHGKIEVESKVGKGSKFTIKIPVTQNQQLPDRAEAEDEGPTVLPPNLNILLVDDEEAICNVVKKFLEEKGYSVVDTTSGKKGLKLFKDKSFDLVLSDITMPDMDGVKLISELKSIDPAIKLVTLTGHVAEKKLEAARKAGADQILLKPFKKEDLYRAIGRALSV